MRLKTLALSLGVGSAALLATVGNGLALEEGKGEKAALKACEKSLCELVTKKAPANGDFSCALAKTWAKKDLKEGSASGKLSWGFGDARCTVDLKLARAVIISAVKEQKSTLRFPDHTVTCVIEREKGPTNVTATLAPKAEFEGGRVKKVWVNLRSVKGPSVIKGLAFTAAKLEDSVGIFHRPLVKALNHMIHEKCPKIAKGG